MSDKLTFLPFLIVLFLALVVPLVLSRQRRLPVVVGEILAGILIGRSGLNLIRPDVTLDFLAEIGLAFLMFLSGLEIDFSSLFTAPKKESPRRNPILAAGLSFFLTLLLAGAVSLLLVRGGLKGDPWMVALILSTTSLGVVLPVLKERRLSTGLFGQTLLLAALLADFFTMLLITAYVGLKTRGLSPDLLLVGVLFVAALLVYRVGLLRTRRISRSRIFEEISGAASHLKLQGALALLLAFVVLSKFLGVEMILGAFLAGAVLSLIGGPDSDIMRRRVESIGFGLFIPLFFITVGLRFDLRALFIDRTIWLLAPALLVAAFLLKIVSALVFRLLFGWRQTMAAGFLLSSRLSLIIAASGIGLSLGVIDQTLNAAFILIAAFTSTFSPLLFSVLQPAAPSREGHPVVIFGISALGLQVAGELKRAGEEVLLLESDSRQAAHALEAGLKVRQEPRLLSALKEIGPSGIKSLLVLTSNDSRNIRISRHARAMGVRHIVALVNHPARIEEFKELEIQTYAPDLQRATLLSLMASNPDLFRILTTHPEGRAIEEVFLTGRRGAGRLLRNLRISSDLLIISIHRGREVLVPHGNTRLESGDVLTVLGDAEAVKDFKARLES